MPVAPTYPGVYIDELPSSVRTIIGVATSIAAFVGPAARGPVDEATHITSWGDFERQFGGLSTLSPMSYAVRQFYQNGGAEAEIVRVATGGKSSEIELSATVVLQARSPGLWGDKLRARVDYGTADPANTQLYNVTVRDMASGAQERFLNVDATKDSDASLERMVRDSSLVSVKSDDNSRPAESAKPTPVTADPFDDNTTADPADAGKTLWVAGGKGKDGDPPDDDAYNGKEDDKTGIYALLNTDIFNLLVIPPNAFGDNGAVPGDVMTNALKLCADRRAILLRDSPSTWTTVSQAVAGMGTLVDKSANGAMFFPDIVLHDGITDSDRAFGPSGSVAGVIARTDVERGVWKAPAGLDATIAGVKKLSVPLTDLENGRLNPLGLNCLRTFPPGGTVVWGSRTLRGADVMANQWKYLPVRRTALFIEESLYRGTKWAVFEPNDEPLWASLRLNVGAFMNTLYRQGAFAGSTPREAYLVKCDRENNPDNDINRGIVNILVGFKPLQPAEFVIIHIQQLAGQLET
jgi:phage tail sheath protein FI